ncbi:MAG: hypothetical protein IMZ64_05495 [Bacteroidetes bacterium]|nr:hypothetical protein [Bacteroidota bacterium]
MIDQQYGYTEEKGIDGDISGYGHIGKITGYKTNGIKKAVRLLLEKNIIEKEIFVNKYGNRYKFNPNVDEWITSIQTDTSTQIDTSIQTDTSSVLDNSYPKENSDPKVSSVLEDTISPDTRSNSPQSAADVSNQMIADDCKRNADALPKQVMPIQAIPTEAIPTSNLPVSYSRNDVGSGVSVPEITVSMPNNRVSGVRNLTETLQKPLVNSL